MTPYERQQRALARIQRNVKRIEELLADPNSYVTVQDESAADLIATASSMPTEEQRVEAIRILRDGGVNLSLDEEAAILFGATETARRRATSEQ